jgi:hypothetical protein
LTTTALLLVSIAYSESSRILLRSGGVFTGPREAGATEGFKAPNIVHYLWYADESVPWTFTQYIGVLSASKVLKPDKIIIHMNIMRPAG